MRLATWLLNRKNEVISLDEVSKRPEGGMLLVSIIGFFVSVFSIYPASKTWGFTLSLFFVILFISSMASISKKDADIMLERERKIALASHPLHKPRKKKSVVKVRVGKKARKKPKQRAGRKRRK